MILHKPVRLSLSKQIAAQMEDCLCGGQWRMGEKIPSEPELMKQFGVSRTTVREAVQGLIHLGVLEARQGDGTYVRALSPFESQLQWRFRTSAPDELLETQHSLELEISRLAALNRTPQDLNLLVTRLSEWERQSHNLRLDRTAGADFHLAVAQAAHNGILWDIYKSILHYLGPVCNGIPAGTEYTAEQTKLYHKLVAAIQRQEPAMAVRAAVNLLALSHTTRTNSQQTHCHAFPGL